MERLDDRFGLDRQQSIMPESICVEPNVGNIIDSSRKSLVSYRWSREPGRSDFKGHHLENFETKQDLVGGSRMIIAFHRLRTI